MGYRNIRTVDDVGREARTVEVDQDRAPLIQWAFERYAEGDVSIKTLASELEARGLTTPTTPKRASRAIYANQLHKMFQNPYYKGEVRFQGVAYEGRHLALVSPDIWQKVQDVMAAHVVGEKVRTHQSYLNGSIFCGNCGHRLSVQHSTNRHGTTYEYFVCAGRHDKRTDCKQRAILIDDVETRVADLYATVSLTADARTHREVELVEMLSSAVEDAELVRGTLSDRQQAQFAGPVLSRLRQFLLRPALKRVLDQSDPKFHLDDVFTKHAILLVPLNTGVLGNDAARLLGSLLVSQLWQLTLARSMRPKTDRPPVAIYIDELQEFIHLGGNDLSDALARSRSLGVAWNLAHQFRDQLPTDTKNALDANALNKIVFGLGAKDAREMAAMAPELTSEDFMTLPQYAIYASLMRNGRHLGWVSGTTSAPPLRTSDPIEILAASQFRYGRDPEPETAASPARARTARTETSYEPIGRRKRGSS